MQTDTRTPSRILKPGEYLHTRAAMQISTVLGSCVAITLFCKRTQDAAICHALLPAPGPASEALGQLNEPGRYLCKVVPLMLTELSEAGCKITEIQAKIFGGSSITRSALGFDKTREVGPENITSACELLARAGILIRASNTGGTTGHHILFNTATGEVLHRLLKPTEVMELSRHG